MSVSVIEGKVIEARVKVRRKAFARFAHVDFQRPDGRTERVGKLVTTSEMADLVQPGAEGRFYLYKTIDLSGIHGVRLADGTERYAYPGNNLVIFGLLIAVSLAWIALRVFGTGDLPLLSVLLLGLGGFGFVMTRNTRAEARRQFDADAGPRVSRPAAGPMASAAD